MEIPQPPKYTEIGHTKFDKALVLIAIAIGIITLVFTLSVLIIC